jgi:uncharacterized protein DUF4331
MKRKVTLIAALAASASLLVTPFTTSASSHREAPAISNDPYADLTDVYAFVAADKPDYVTLIMDAIPYENPMGGPVIGIPSWRGEKRARW